MVYEVELVVSGLRVTLVNCTLKDGVEGQGLADEATVNQIRRLGLFKANQFLMDLGYEIVMGYTGNNGLIHRIYRYAG